MRKYAILALILTVVSLVASSFYYFVMSSGYASGIAGINFFRFIGPVLNCLDQSPVIVLAVGLLIKRNDANEGA